MSGKGSESRSRKKLGRRFLARYKVGKTVSLHLAHNDPKHECAYPVNPSQQYVGADMHSSYF